MNGPAPPSPEAPPAEILAAYEERWRRCASEEGHAVLRLAILRDLMRELHVGRSRALATARREEARAFKGWEDALEALRGSPTLARKDSELGQAFTPGRRGPKPRPPVLPQALVEAIGPERISRYDRVWEAAIAESAYREGWAVWTVDVWVRVVEAELFDDRLGERLAPHGAVLFAEAARSDGSLDGEDWLGRWWLVLERRWKTPQFGIDALSTARDREPPLWTLRLLPR